MVRAGFGTRERNCSHKPSQILDRYHAKDYLRSGGKGHFIGGGARPSRGSKRAIKNSTKVTLTDSGACAAQPHPREHKEARECLLYILEKSTAHALSRIPQYKVFAPRPASWNRVAKLDGEYPAQAIGHALDRQRRQRHHSPPLPRSSADNQRISANAAHRKNRRLHDVIPQIWRAPFCHSPLVTRDCL